MWKVSKTQTGAGRDAWTVVRDNVTSVHKFLTAKEAGLYAETLNRIDESNNTHASVYTNEKGE